MLNGCNAEALCDSARLIPFIFLRPTMMHSNISSPREISSGHFNGQLSVVKCGIVTAELRFVCKTNPFAVDMKCGVRIQPKTEIVAVCPIVQIMAGIRGPEGQSWIFHNAQVAKVTEQVEAGIFHISNGIFVGKLGNRSALLQTGAFPRQE